MQTLFGHIKLDGNKPVIFSANVANFKDLNKFFRAGEKQVKAALKIFPDLADEKGITIQIKSEATSKGRTKATAANAD